MHIFINNNKFFIGDYRVKCALGKRGIGNKKKEGDLITPIGRFKIKYILYRKDRVFNLQTSIAKKSIKKNMGWCDDPLSKRYNQLVRFPFSHKAEKLYKKENTYDIILVLNYNCNPIKKNKGSAIFIHIAKKKYKKTLGCIAISKKNLLFVAKNINNKTIVNIS